MAILESNMCEFVSHSADQTRRLGMRLGSLMKVQNLICLSGNLGAGKTTFVQGLAAGWGSTDQVTSPTYVLINQYERLTGGTMYHLDAYRIANSIEAEELDLDLMLDNGVLVIEWPERINDVLAVNRLWINLEYVSEDKRRFVFKPVGKYYEDLSASFRKRSFGGL